MAYGISAVIPLQKDDQDGFYNEDFETQRFDKDEEKTRKI